jgi:hypothetical protein
MSDILDSIVSDANKPTASSDALEQISALAREQVDLEDQLLQAENKVKELKRALYDVSEVRLPEALLSVGMTSFTLEDGSTISCGKVYQAHISKANADAAHDWLRDNGHGDIIKNEIKVNFGKDQDAEANAFKEQLNAQGQVYTAKEAVHASTLKSFVRGELENGRDVPNDLFGVHLTTVSKVTRRT